jgi:hypothetical protein
VFSVLLLRCISKMDMPSSIEESWCCCSRRCLAYSALLHFVWKSRVLWNGFSKGDKFVRCKLCYSLGRRVGIQRLFGIYLEYYRGVEVGIVKYVLF